MNLLERAKEELEEYRHLCRESGDGRKAQYLAQLIAEIDWAMRVKREEVGGVNQTNLV